MKVARKHIIAAIETEGQLLLTNNYAIKAYPYVGKNKRVGEFGWTISVVPMKDKK